MTEVELFNMLGKESIVFVAIILVWYLFVRPKDTQIEIKDKHITELVETNRTIVRENSEQLSKISGTMEKISTELTTLNDNQHELKDGQDDLWREVVRLKRRDTNDYYPE